MARNKIVAGNWKMNLSRKEAIALHKGVFDKSKSFNCDVYQFVPSIYLSELIDLNLDGIHVGAQNGYPKTSGAFTGEVSMKQLADIGVKSVLIGHSERRQLFNESNQLLKQKVDAALAENINILFCCGETLDERESGDHENIVTQQLKDSLFHLSADQMKNVVIAYEPIWAIGTGKTATADQANKMHKSIRNALTEKYNDSLAQETSILYGGSCKPNNASELFSKENIDGGLIGGASLKVEDFIEIINAWN
ncbi:MAG: triose-phosphate isomerase [Brumimicrobium sp.]